VIIEDDYDAEFRYDRAPIGALQGLAPDHVAYIGSTSKTLSPGIRLGWAVLPRELVEPVREELRHSVLHLSGVDQLALADFFRCGEFERHMRRMRIIYRRKRDATVKNLRVKLPELPVRGIAAGLHVMLELDTQEAESAICAAAEAHGLAIEALSEHALPGYGGPPGLLIGYAGLSMPTIPVAMERLVAAVASGTSTRR
jgi:GntR family transcriptional regulator/MocR family aminotransferase